MMRQKCNAKSAVNFFFLRYMCIQVISRASVEDAQLQKNAYYTVADFVGIIFLHLEKTG